MKNFQISPQDAPASRTLVDVVDRVQARTGQDRHEIEAAFSHLSPVMYEELIRPLSTLIEKMSEHIEDLTGPASGANSDTKI